MALRIGSLYVSLTANSTGLVKGFADAAKAAEKVAKDVKKASSEVAQVAGTFAALGGAAVKLASSVDGPTKKAMDGLEKSTKLLAVQVADMLLPAVREVGAMFQRAASAVAGLDPETKKSISNFAVLAVQLALAGKAMSLVASVSSQVLGAMRAVAAVIAGIGVGPLLAIVATLAVVAAGIAALHYAFRTNLGGIADAWKSLLDWLGSTWNGVFEGVLSGLNSWAIQVTLIFRGVIGLMEKVARARGDTQAAAGYGVAGRVIETSLATFGGVGMLKAAAVQGLELGKAVGDAFVDEWKRILSGMDLGGMFKGGKTISLGRGMGAAAAKGPAISGAVSRDFGGINAGGAWLHEMDKLAKDTAKGAAAVDKARLLEMKSRLAIASDLEKQKRIAGAIQSGTTATLSKPDRGVADQQMAATMSDAVNASSWGAAMATLEAGLQGSLTFGRELQVWGARMSGLLGSSGKQILGAVGDLVDSVVQGAQAGGVWGAIIAAFMEIAKKTASAMKFLDTAMAFVGKLAEMVEPLVAPIFDALTDVLAAVLNAIGPLFAALQPLFDAFSAIIKDLMPIFDGLGYVIQALSPILELIGRLVQALEPLIKVIFEIIGGVLKVVATVVLGIIIAANEIAAAFGDEAARAESDRLKGIVDKMWNPNDGAAQAEARANTRATIENTAATEANTAVTNESLTNVPSGYKLALARFNADMGITGSAAFVGAGAGGGTTINGDVYVTTDGETVEQIAEDARREAARELGQQRGTGAPPRGRCGRD